jgi:hypothetical protein
MVAQVHGRLEGRRAGADEGGGGVKHLVSPTVSITQDQTWNEAGDDNCIEVNGRCIKVAAGTDRAAAIKEMRKHKPPFYRQIEELRRKNLIPHLGRAIGK